MKMGLTIYWLKKGIPFSIDSIGTNDVSLQAWKYIENNSADLDIFCKHVCVFDIPQK